MSVGKIGIWLMTCPKERAPTDRMERCAPGMLRLSTLPCTRTTSLTLSYKRSRRSGQRKYHRGSSSFNRTTNPRTARRSTQTSLPPGYQTVYIRMLYQPPNSPDLNVLDLGFFAAIQSIQYSLSGASTTSFDSSPTLFRKHHRSTRGRIHHATNSTL